VPAKDSLGWVPNAPAHLGLSACLSSGATNRILFLYLSALFI
jgi:hypothetical protein